MATKQALPVMKRGADGRQKLHYVDAKTGEEVTDFKDYEIITGGGTDYYDPTPDGTDEDADEQDLNPDEEEKSAHREKVELGPNGGQKSRQQGAGYSYATSQAKRAYQGANRGYINKPAWAKFANFLPGMAGMVAKGVNMSINANNVAAVNSARKAMGLDPVGIGGAIKGTFKDNQGQIARVDIGEGQYSVGFEALDKYGRTNMTPEEAMARARALGVDISEVEMTKPTDGTAKKGLLTRAKEAIFGPEETQQTETEQSSQPTSQTATTSAKPGSAPATNSGSLAGMPTGNAGTGPLGRPESQVQSAYGSHRPNAPEAVAKQTIEGQNYGIQDAAVRAVQDALGPDYGVVGTSGTEGSLAQFGSNRHKTGLAMDFGVKNMKTGQMVTDQNQLASVAEAFAARNPEANVGLGPNYMGGVAIHADLTNFGGNVKGQGVTWGGYPGLAGIVSDAKTNVTNPNFAYAAPTGRPATPNEFASVVGAKDSILGGPLGLEPGANMLAAGLERNVAAMNAPPTTTNTVTSRFDTPVGSMPAARPDVSNLSVARNAFDTQKANTVYGDIQRNAFDTQQSPTAYGTISRNAFDTQYGVSRDAINAGITGFDMGAINGATNPANTISAQQAALPGISRNAFDTNYGYAAPDAARFGTGISRDTKLSTNPVSGMAMAPSDAPDPSRFGGGIAADLSPTEHQSVFSGAAPTSTSKAMLGSAIGVTGAPNRFDGVDLSSVSPAKMASLGLVNRTEQERQSMARTIAGELGPKSLKALAAQDPTAMAEVANMVASMENRAAVARYGTMAAVLDPSQYNSLAAANLGVTNQNYGLYGAQIDQAVANFYTGMNQPTNFGITNYYNGSLVDPTWGAAMTNPAQVGQHVFGGIPGDYKPGEAFNAQRDAYAAAQISDTRGFTPSQFSTNNPSYSSTGPLGSSGSMAAARAADRASYGYQGSGKSATSQPGSAVSGASRSTAGKTSGYSGGSGGSGSSGGGNYGGGSSSYGGGSAGKAASGGVSGASRSTAGKGGASPSAGSGGLSGASRSTSGKTGGSGKSNPGTSGNMGSGGGTTSGKGAGIGSA